MEHEQHQPQGHCLLEHKVFTQLGDPVFRRAHGDGAPVMVVRWGEGEAVLPLRSLQREFGISDDSPDGRMLVQIADSLDYICALRLGDPLPAEILTGEASWEPDRSHFRLASAQLKYQLVAWLQPGSAAASAATRPECLVDPESDVAVRQQVQEAFSASARALGLADPAAVLALVEDLARELAYVEALRERLFNRIQSMAAKVERLRGGRRTDAGTAETITQVSRLTRTALGQIGRRFAELDAQTGEVIAALRNLESHRAFIRTNRDWLYRALRAWEPLLLGWDNAGFGLDEHNKALLIRSYQFLAVRYMPVTEWESEVRPRRKREQDTNQMVW